MGGRRSDCSSPGRSLGLLVIWKAIIVIWIASDMAPLSMMLGEFKPVFLSEDTCQAFLLGRRPVVAEKLLSIDEDDFKVIAHKTSCVQDGNGQPT